MASFYFDESIHPVAGFIVGSWVAWREDPTRRINEALLRAGLRPGVDEFKSGARMLGNAPMARAREGLFETIAESRIGVVVLPATRRSDTVLEALRGLAKILSTMGLGVAGHEAFLDQGLLADRRAFDILVDDLNLGEATLHVEQDSIAVPGLQVADLVAHTCATMLLAELGLVTKWVKARDDSGYEPENDIALSFLLWATLRQNFFGAPPPPPDQWESQLDWQVDVESRGLFIADSCSAGLRYAARERFAKMYLGCTH